MGPRTCRISHVEISNGIGIGNISYSTQCMNDCNLSYDAPRGILGYHVVLRHLASARNKILKNYLVYRSKRAYCWKRLWFTLFNPIETIVAFMRRAIAFLSGPWAHVCDENKGFIQTAALQHVRLWSWLAAAALQRVRLWSYNLSRVFSFPR